MELRDGTIYVLGGMTESGRFPRGRVPVEWYDHDRDVWCDKSKMLVSKIPFMGSMMSRDIPYCRLEFCSLRIFQGAKFDDLTSIG